MKGISRINVKSPGWFVRLYRDGKTISKFFSDGAHGDGDSNKSLWEAQSYYQKMQREYPAKPKPPFYQKPLSNNKSGYNGVCETYTRTKSGGKIPCWCVSWYTSKKLRSKSFYFHDEQERRQALKEAVRFRKMREAEILRHWQNKKKRR
jgi:hypothetical protein